MSRPQGAPELFNAECSTPFSKGQTCCLPSLQTLRILSDRASPHKKGLAVTKTLAALLDQALPVWNPKLSFDEAKPENTGKEKDWELRDQLQKETSQLRAKEKEVRRQP